MELKERYKIKKTALAITATDTMNDTLWTVPLPLLDLLQEPYKEKAREWKRRYQKARLEVRRLKNKLSLKSS